MDSRLKSMLEEKLATRPSPNQAIEDKPFDFIPYLLDLKKDKKIIDNRFNQLDDSYFRNTIETEKGNFVPYIQFQGVNISDVIESLLEDKKNGQLKKMYIVNCKETVISVKHRKDTFNASLIQTDLFFRSLFEEIDKEKISKVSIDANFDKGGFLMEFYANGSCIIGYKDPTTFRRYAGHLIPINKNYH